MTTGLASGVANSILDSLARNVSWTAPAAFCVKPDFVYPAATHGSLTHALDGQIARSRNGQFAVSDEGEITESAPGSITKAHEGILVS